MSKVVFTPGALFLLLSSLLPLCGSATLIPVKYKQGTAHGFIVLRSQSGETLASGEMLETVKGDDVTGEMVLHFNDGSFYEEVTEYSQKKDFLLLQDHVRQRGPSFPIALDTRINAATGEVVISSEKAGQHKSERHQLKIPEDASNGLFLTLLENIPQSAAETTLSMVTTTLKPRVVKLKIRADGKQAFSAGGQRLEAIHYVIHIDIGGVAGVIAPVIGKQPSDLHFWITDQKAPTFIKFTGQLYAGGPIWNIELASVNWENNQGKVTR